jgi:hypothetical protein
LRKKKLKFFSKKTSKKHGGVIKISLLNSPQEGSTCLERKNQGGVKAMDICANFGKSEAIFQVGFLKWRKF